MADVITRFKLETTQYDSKLRDASKSLAEYTRKATQAGNEFGKFTQKNVEAARALGNITPSATNAKDKVKELVGAFNDAARAYNALTKEQQQSDFGRAMAGSMQQLQVKIREAKQELYGLDGAMKKVSKGNNTMNQLLGGVAGKFGMSASMFTGVGAAVAGVGAAYKAISDNISTAMGFEKSISQLSSLTGMVGKDLEQLKEYAIELGSTSTLTASQVADAFRLIGSQQPQLLSSADALKEVTKNAITLSEAAGIDLVTAAQTLSTSINQMGGDSDNAARYVNVLAAASQKGAGDIAWLGEAITKSATAAKAVGTDYEELVANLEQLAKGGFDASTAGTALRSIIMNLEKQANQEFKPSIVGLTQAFENLGKANLDIVGYQEIAGKMFASQAKVLADAAGEARNMTTAITGTNTATQQASTNTANLEGSLKSLASAWEGLNLHINSSNGYLKTAVDWLKDVVVWADKAITGLGEVKGNRDKLNSDGNGGQTKVDRMVGNLENTSINRRQSVYTQQVSAYWKYINEWEKKLKEAESRKDVFAWETIKKNNDIAEAKANVAGAQSMLKEYQSKAQKLLRTSSPSPGKGGSNNSIVVDVDVDTEEGTKSIKELQNEIKKLKKLRDDASSAGDTKLRDQYNAQIKSVQAEIKSMRGTGSTSTNHKIKTEEQLNNEEIQKLTQEYIKASDDRRKAIEGEIKKLQDRNKEIARLKDMALCKIGDDGSLSAMTQQLKELQNAQSESASGREWDEYQKKIDDVTAKINVLKGVLPKDQQATFTVEVNAEQLEQLRMLLPNNEDTVRVNVEEGRVNLPEIPKEDETIRVNITATTADAMKEVRDMVGEIEGWQVAIEPKIEIKEEDLRTPFEKLRDSLKIEIAEENMQVDTTTLQTLMKTAIQNGIDGLDPNFSALQEKMREGMNIPDDTWQALQDEINEKLKELGIEPIKIDFKTGKIDESGKTVEKSWQSAAKAVQAVGSAMESIEDPAAKIAGTVAQAIANIALGYSQAMLTPKDPVSWIAFGAAGLAQMLAMMNAIHSSTGYANGGIVKGNSYSGDNIPAMIDGGAGGFAGLNAGEVVLNASMQNMLAQNLQGSGLQNLSVSGEISGESIKIVLNRYLKRSGQGEIVTW